MPSHDSYAPTAWADASPLFDLKLPSGQLCQVRRLSIDRLAAMGLLDQMDVLTNLMETSVAEPARKGKKPQDRRPKALTKAQALSEENRQVAEMFSNPAQLGAMFGMVDKIVEAVVVQPALARAVTRDADGNEVPLPDEEREDGVIYVDTIPLADRMMIFSSVFGDLGDLPSFRVESSEALGDLADEPDLPGSA
jgi:hypothetical protein